MDLRNMMRIIRGHPVIIITGLVLTLATAAVLMSRVEPEFEAKASVLLFTPTEVQTEEGAILNRNPLENPQAVAVTANALTDVMHSTPVAQRLADNGLLGSYAVEVNPNGGGAILALRTTGPSAPAAFEGMEVLLRELSVELENMQRRMGIDPSTWINDEPFNLPTEATPVTGSKARVLAISLGLGLIGTYGLAVLADSIYGERPLLRGRRARRAAMEGSPIGEPATAPINDDGFLLDDLARREDEGTDPPSIRAV